MIFQNSYIHDYDIIISKFVRDRQQIAHVETVFRVIGPLCYALDTLMT